jgi:hypothetical protein
MLKMLRPDSKGRVTLGHLADGVSGFSVEVTADHKILLEPFSEIPSREKWLFDNKKALDSVSRGLTDAQEGRVSSRGSFSQYAEDDED